MAYPANVATVTVTAKFTLSSGGSGIPTGYLTFAPNVQLKDSGTSQIIEVEPLTVTLDGTGAISVVLMATDDAHLSPSGWAYTITEAIAGRPSVTYTMQFPAAQPVVDLASKAPLAQPPALVAYALDTAVVHLGPAPSGDTTGATDAATLTALAQTLVAGGGVISLRPGTYYINASLPLLTGVSWVGSGRGSTVIQAANGANCDVFLGDQFATLTNGGTAAGPYSFVIADLIVDGNRAHNSSGYGIRVYGYTFEIRNVVVRNCADDGMYTEWAFTGAPTDGMEARYRGLVLHDNGKWGWHNRGPHDSTATDVIIYNNNQVAGNYGGLWVENDNTNTPARWLAGALQLVNSHIWGTTHAWALIAEGSTFVSNTQIEGANVGQVLALAAVIMRGGKIFNLTNNNRVPNLGIQLGDDGTTAGYANTRSWTVGKVDIDTHMQGFYGSARASAVIAWVSANASRLALTCDMVSPPTAYTISSPIGTQLSSLATVTLASAPADFPLAGQCTVPASGGTATLAYTGISGSILTGISVVSGTGTWTLSAGSATLVTQLITGTQDKQSSVFARGMHGSATPAQRATWGADGIVARTSWYGGASGTIEAVSVDAGTGLVEAAGVGETLTRVASGNLGSTGSIGAQGSGSSMRGQISFTPGGTGIAAGTMVTVTLPAAFRAANPVVIVSPASSATAALGVYATSTSKTVFLIGTNVAPTSGVTYFVNYWVIG